ncbi:MULTISPECIES: molybdopterin-guanine dinucleotide biosynthesis protein B [unclassified Bacillus (in: firmicutes)]|uniref:molybdopterin-guanine dinucleotide biosynthesis protein B n=1 Tax=unclassified Bacillus (in: firmicutes) TaxID=185979 RepID=UPI00041204E3|nr:MULTISPECIES: molybdopterin-guanine dinucleotide biosynthesis protein B [unclassified Bacillus (in: firmicutes)]QHZ46616.1 molybdopterin-guanine dinucleotide biosynthesis protein B [Bacillus sp. NSP9.1]WFA06749.1 molybdopterin-guanine dinucleotide biosynthesis protein B [Bacillus sp. HSf4]
MAAHFPILQIVGYQNSGKTSFVEMLADKLEHSGVKVGCLKHHGHGGEPEALTEGKDSDRFWRAGAAVSGVEGAGVLQLSARGDWTLEKLIALYSLMPIDCLLIEGFKQAAFPKVVMVRNEADGHLLEQLSGTIAVIYRDSQPREVPNGVPSFHIADPGAMSYILNHLKEEGVCLNDSSSPKNRL